MLLLILFALFLLPVSALAQFVDPNYGNPVFPAENYRPMPGGAAYRDLDGRTHYEYVKPADPMPQPPPSSPPSVHAQPRPERYEFLRDFAPDTGNSYRSDSIFSDIAR
jgi:hypothetical protein